jgi:DNA-binding transcriptional ArsR family regulator
MENQKEQRNEYLKDDLRVFVVPLDILHADLDIYEKMAYMVLRSFANAHNPQAWPKYSTIAELASMSERQAMRVIKSLEEKGLIKKEVQFKVTKKRQIKHTSNLYTILNPKKESMSDLQSPLGVTHRHPKGDSQTPLGVTDSHMRGDSQSYKQDHLTKQERTYPLNNNNEEVVQPELDLPEPKEQPKEVVVVDEKDNVIRSLLALQGIKVNNHTFITWRKHASHEIILQCVQDTLAKPGVKNIIAYVTGALEKGYTPAASSPPQMPTSKKNDLPDYVSKQLQNTERGDDHVDQDKQIGALDLLLRLGEIDEEEYTERKKVLTGI